MTKIPRQLQALLQLISLVAIITTSIWYSLEEIEPYLASISSIASPSPLFSPIGSSPVASPTVNGAAINHIKVIRVIDGDTIEVEGGQKVRYIGIDTPETQQPARFPECFGQEATIKNRELVDQKLVRLEKDVSEIDRYGRLLRYVYIDDVMINQLLVSDGYAVARSYPPDVKYQEIFVAAEQSARQSKQGLWGEACQPQASPLL